MWIWLGLAALALIGELATGTFYLLLVALGLAGGGVAAWLNAGLEWQLLACGVVVLLGLVILRKTRVLKSARSTRPAMPTSTWTSGRSCRWKPGPTTARPASGIAALTGRLNWPRGTRPMAASMSSPNCAARAWCSRPGMHPAARAKSRSGGAG